MATATVAAATVAATVVGATAAASRDRATSGDSELRRRPAKAEEVSFEDSFDAEVAAEFGDLGPGGDDRPRSGGDDGGRRRRRRR